MRKCGIIPISYYNETNRQERTPFSAQTAARNAANPAENANHWVVTSSNKTVSGNIKESARVETA
jgi:ribosomal protein S11